MRIGRMEPKNLVESAKSEPRAPRQIEKRPRPSDEEIRAKIVANQGKQAAPVQLGEKMGFSRNENPPAKPSDVGLNDPNDPATRGKLKQLLASGAINFNDRERGTLQNILEHDE